MSPTAIRLGRHPVAAYMREVEGPYNTVMKQEVVVCDDGAVFWRPAGDKDGWQVDNPIPGTKAAEAGDSA
jgi:hypothetical protein